MAKQSNENVVEGLALGEESAGAGALGLLGAAAVFAIAIVFFVAESYFLAMLLVSFALLVYAAGGELGKLVRVVVHGVLLRSPPDQECELRPGYGHRAP